jgi:hypothetical protein
MQIYMLFTRYGSENGFIVRRFLEKHHYEIADSLGLYFVRIGVAKLYCCHPAFIEGSEAKSIDSNIVIPDPATSAE